MDTETIRKTNKNVYHIDWESAPCTSTIGLTKFLLLRAMVTAFLKTEMRSTRRAFIVPVTMHFLKTDTDLYVAFF